MMTKIVAPNKGVAIFLGAVFDAALFIIWHQGIQQTTCKQSIYTCMKACIM